MTALTPELKSRIQAAYDAWLAARGFKARTGQRHMIAHVARTCASEQAPRLVAIEAGTGTGKTAAYCLAAIPVAQALDKTVVIASGTVALQEQIVLRDLPDLKRSAGLDFRFELAKGRRRYLCLERLDRVLKLEEQEDLGFVDAPKADFTPLYRQMSDAFSRREWSGEMDTWEDGVEPQAWSSLTMDHRGCTHRKCSFYKDCPFFAARAKLHGADVIVANQDLLLTNYALGDGTALPPPGDTIVIIDEAHHLPDKTQQHFALRVHLRSTIGWVDQVNVSIGGMAQRAGRPLALERLAKEIALHSDGLKSELEALHSLVGELQFLPKDAHSEVCRFNFGRIEKTLAQAAEAPVAALSKIHGALDDTDQLLRQVLDGDLDWPDTEEDVGHWLPVVGGLQARALATRELLEDFAQADGEAEEGMRRARWIRRTEQELELVSAPIEPGLLLEKALWSQCYAGIATSATLTALGRFDRYFERSGLAQTEGVRIQSSFDYPNIAVLSVPKMRSDPKDFPAHTAEVAALLPTLLTAEGSALVLCTSWRQMRQIAEELATKEDLNEALQLQGQCSKQRMLDRHRRRVDAGQASYLMGLASFAEGVDLPGDYCRHVIIVKLPFAVPDDPLDQAIAEMAELQGRNAFMEITVPDAALKLVQACGRLIRDDSDYGRITLLDKRVLTKRYGQALLDSLPPFRRELGNYLNPLGSSTN